MSAVSRVVATPHEVTLRVRPADLDERQHVNNVVYLRWVQDAAAAHWNVLAPDDARDTIAWVALRHEIDYLTAAMLEDEILVRTWVGVAAGLSFERFTEIYRRADERLLARARTLWCPVDRRTGKPQRVSADVRARCSVAAGEGEEAS
jgi:acyl-CoA thioester hydrolase